MIKIINDELFSYEGVNFRIKRVISDRIHVVGENLETRETKMVPIVDIRKPILPDVRELYPVIPADLLTEQEEALAKKRLKIIEPFIDKYIDPNKLELAARKNKVGKSTIYRWRARYQKTRHLSSLIDREGRGGKGKSKISDEQEKIIQEAISSKYYKKKSVADTFLEVKIQCTRSGLSVPNLNTVKKRIAQKTEKTAIKFRRSRQIANQQFEGKPGKIPDAKYPFSIVQIDHTRLDIILVDPVYRKPLTRPWLTLLIDVFSRCPMGFYLSLDPPGNFGTGQAIANAMYPKIKLLTKYNITEEWPCWGAMKTIHSDNAGEFHSKMIEKACLAYGIGIQWRPKKKPHYGAHIERLLGTFNREIHTLPGTTFSNIKERKYFEYDSKMYAAFTLEEFEEWLVTYITKVYMIRPHTGIGTSPLSRLKKGLMGEYGGVPAAGLTEFHEDEDTLRLDFMPLYERTIQSSGVQIENMEYYHPLLAPYINLKEEFEFDKKREKKKFIFKMDIRNIKKIYFMDPDSKVYYEIPSINLSCPDMSIWEKREVERKLKAENKDIDTNAIIEGYLAMRTLEESAINKTKQSRRRQSREAERQSKPMPKGEVVGDYSVLPEVSNAAENSEKKEKKKPKRFNVDHGAFGSENN
ncbi:MAG: Mu transposase C-terminal domain-containing protein [Cyclobacteriaceae bacterium]|jgi:putative transposase